MGEGLVCGLRGKVNGIGRKDKWGRLSGMREKKD